MAQPPEWQFWTDIGVKAVSAIGTVSAVIVALFGAKLRSVLMPPRLTLSLKERRGLRVGFTIPIDGGSDAQTYARWYFARVENGTRWNSADGVYIFILSIEPQDASGTFNVQWKGEMPLKWRHQHFSRRRSVIRLNAIFAAS